MKRNRIKFKTYKRQQDIINSWLNPNIKYTLAVCGRQVGKSYAARICALHAALKPIYCEKKAKLAYFLPTGASASTQFDAFVNLIEEYKIVVKSINKSKKEIKFTNDNNLVFLSADLSSANGLRGKTLDYVIIDEACFIDDYMMNTIIFPMMNTAFGANRGKVLMITTADGKNLFYKLFTSEAKDIESIKFTSYDSPLSSKDYLDRQREMMPEDQFRQEYLAEFLDGLNSIFKTSVYKYNELNSIVDTNGAVAAVDWAISNDYTVLSIINKNRELIGYYRWKDADHEDIIAEICNILNSKGNPDIYSEQNGVGAVPTQMLKKKYRGSVYEFVTTNKSKNDIITKLCNDLISETNPLVLLKDEVLITEFNNFGKEIKSGGLVKYSNMSSDTNDDIVMSIAIANYHLKEYVGYKKLLRR